MIELSTTFQEALGWTLIHSFWQASLVALLMSIVLKLIPSKESGKRYKTTVIALISLTLLSVGTFLYLYNSLSKPNEEVMQALTSNTSNLLLHDTVSFDRTRIINMLPIINKVWFVGLVLLFVRLFFSFGYIQWLKRNTEKADEILERGLLKIKDSMGIASLRISIVQSKLIHSPMVIGHLKPIIFFPVGVLNSLSIEEVEAIIAHEVSHIIRYDYLVNMLLAVVESLYYYHPAVWWISANIKVERENCCDDKTVNLGYQNTIYAKALLKLTELQHKRLPSLAMPLIAKRGQLLNRIKRILNMPQNRNDMREKIIASILMLTMLVMFTSAETITPKNDKTVAIQSLLNMPSELNSLVPKIESITEREPIVISPRKARIFIDTLPNHGSNSSMSIISESNGKRIEMEKKNGKITKLKIDGEEIDEMDYDKYKDLVEGFDGDVNSFYFDFSDMEDQFRGFNNFHFSDDSTTFKYFNDVFGKEDFEGFEDFNDFFQGGTLRFFGDSEDGPFRKIGPQRIDDLLRQVDSLRSGVHMFNFDNDNFPGGFHFQFPNDGDFPSNSLSFGDKTVVDHIGSALNKDGLLRPYKSNKIELSGKYLKINGEKMPSAIFEKYKDIYQEKTGAPLTKGSKMVFDVEGRKSKRKVRTF